MSADHNNTTQLELERINAHRDDFQEAYNRFTALWNELQQAHADLNDRWFGAAREAYNIKHEQLGRAFLKWKRIMAKNREIVPNSDGEVLAFWDTDGNSIRLYNAYGSTTLCLYTRKYTRDNWQEN